MVSGQLLPGRHSSLGLQEGMQFCDFGQQQQSWQYPCSGILRLLYLFRGDRELLICVFRPHAPSGYQSVRPMPGASSHDLQRGASVAMLSVMSPAGNHAPKASYTASSNESHQPAPMGISSVLVTLHFLTYPSIVGRETDKYFNCPKPRAPHASSSS